MSEYKYTDKNHPPVPRLKVGDKCYTFCDFGRRYDYVSTCEIRKVEVKWHEKDEHWKEDCSYWYIDYYIRIIETYGKKTTKMFSYSLGDDGREPNLFLTPQEVMDANIRDFMDMVMKNIKSIQSKMFALGYTKEQTKKLLEYKVDGE